MSKSNKRSPLSTRQFSAADGLSLTGDVGGDAYGVPVLLLHGGGQTRHSWGTAARSLAARGFYAIALDMRGHGDSDWAENGDYSLNAFARDVASVCRQLPERPVIVGASLGGLSALIAVAESEDLLAQALVLVDVTPRIEEEGADRINAFMRARPDGFETLDDVADAVAGYLPGRSRPKDTQGLLKNVRLRNGRYFWHWDPALVSETSRRLRRETERLERAAKSITLPMLLVRGARSDIVSRETAEHLKSLAPHSEFVDIAEAGHMVAGDKNDAFNSAVFDFLDRHGFSAASAPS